MAEETKETTEEKVVETKVEETKVEENTEFDVSKFAEAPIEKKEDSGTEEKVDEEESSEEGNDDDIQWAGYDDEEEEKIEQKKDDKTEDKTDANDDVEGKEKEQEQSTSSISSEQFKSFAEELGLNVNSPEELKQAILDLEAENETLRNSGGNKGVTNDKIERLSNLKSKSDEELIRLDLKSQGFTDEDINEAVDAYIDSNLLKIEGKKIRNTIDKTIATEQDTLTKSKVESEAMSKKQYEDSVKSLTEHIGKTETMFGLKIAKDEESLGKVRKGHLSYITSGNYLNDITKDNQSMIESAWLWKNKDTILKAFKNAGIQKGKEEILNDIKEVEVSNTQRFKGPESSDGFNPKDFVFGTGK